MARPTVALPPVIPPAARWLLRAVFAGFGLLCLNAVYLAGVGLLEWWQGGSHQGYFYQLMFLAHLLLGLALIPVFAAFVALHLPRALRRPNRYARRAGLVVLTASLTLILSGLALMRVEGLELRDPDLRAVLYWLHVAVPGVLIWAFVLHRLAGPAIRWRPALILAGGAALTAGAVVLAPVLQPEAAPVTRTFEPSLMRLAGTEGRDPRQWVRDDYCARCHEDVHASWTGSMHRFSSFNNPAYLFSVRELREELLARDGDPAASRLCAGCHDLIPLMAGYFDRADFDSPEDPYASAGITCTVCHGISELHSNRGNSDFTLEAPQHYPFAFSEVAALRWLSRQLVRAKPEFHRRSFLKPLHRSPEFCGACHKVHLPEALNGYKWLRGQNHYDSFRLSGVSGHGVASFHYPQRAVSSCGSCHMPLEVSSDFGAARYDDSGLLKVHNHAFAAANTAVPVMVGLPETAVTRRQDFLRDSLRLDLFGLRRDGSVDGELLGPLQPGAEPPGPGVYLLQVVLSTQRLGHHFTQGTADSNQVWVQIELWDGERLLGSSGRTNGLGEVDPWAHFVNVYMLDREGRRIDRRNAQHAVVALYNHQIPPGASHTLHYRIRVPEEIRDGLRLRARLNYRKFDTTYLRHIQGEAFRGNQLPVTVIAEADLRLDGADGTPPAPTWARWNDYGIGLLLTPGAGLLRQAEQAFLRVAERQPEPGLVNLARVYLREGRLQEAGAMLARAAELPNLRAPWTLTWLSALVDTQNGELQAAADKLQRLLRTDFAGARERGFDFSGDYRVWNQLGLVRLEQAKALRGAGGAERRGERLRQARAAFAETLGQDPENLTAHYGLSQVYTLLGNPQAAAFHSAEHTRYKPDDNAGDRAVALHRARNPAANRSAEAVVIYELRGEPLHGG